EAVVLGWIVRPGHLDRAIGREMGSREIEGGSRHRPYVDDVDAGSLKAPSQRGGELLGARSVVPSDDHPGATVVTIAADHRTERATERVCHIGREVAPDHPPDVVLSEDVRVDR